MKGRLFIVSGPSGVGKDTVLQAWSAANPLVERVVATTTRSPRPGEEGGVDYDFVTVKVFNRKVDIGEFLEYKLVHGNWYGTPAASVDSLLGEGKFAVLKIDVQGAVDVMAKRPDAVSVFILPPSWDALEIRIRGRGTEDPVVIEKRLVDAKTEISFASKYSHQVVNDVVSEAVAKLEEIARRTE